MNELTEPRPGDGLLTRISGPAGLGIAALQEAARLLSRHPTVPPHRAKYHHVASVIDRDWVVEAPGFGGPSGGRSHIVPLEQACRGTALLFRPPLTDAQVGQAADLWPKHHTEGGLVGVFYSGLDYGALTALHLLGRPWPPLADFVKATKHQQCAQLWDWGYRILPDPRRNWIDGRLSMDVAPMDVEWLVEREGWPAIPWPPR